MRGDVQDANHCRAIIDKAISELGAIDVLFNNAAHQASFKSIDDISRFDETDQEGDDVCCQVSEQSIGSTWEFGLSVSSAISSRISAARGTEPWPSRCLFSRSHLEQSL
jgi:NAD(P)-dependent dehydrogenase (short-subunit alcohol dehydrogenase family)